MDMVHKKILRNILIKNIFSFRMNKAILWSQKMFWGKRKIRHCSVSVFQVNRCRYGQNQTHLIVETRVITLKTFRIISKIHLLVIFGELKVRIWNKYRKTSNNVRAYDPKLRIVKKR